MPRQPLPTAGQNWEPMILSSKKTESSDTKVKPTLTNKERKLEDATEAEKKELLPRNISLQLVSARVAHVPKITQKDLANQLNIPIKTIQEIEQHRYQRDMALAQRIARHLKVKLER